MNTRIVRESMSDHLVTVGWKEPIEDAHRKMQKRHLRHLPVLNDQGEVVGMLSDRDVQRSMISQVRHEKPDYISSESIEFDPEALVRDYMGWPVLTVDFETDLRLVAERMLKEKVSSFLVQKGNRTVGIVTSDDLLKVLMSLLGDPREPVRWTLGNIISETSHRFDGVLV